MERLSGQSSNNNNGIRQHALEGNDHISNLPLTIMLYILSFLPFKDWITMSLVSRQWKNIWTYAQSLDFDEVQMIKIAMGRYTLCPLCSEVFDPSQHQCLNHLLYAARMEFMEHVDLVLQRHSGCTISKFQISMQDDAPGKYASRIDSWVHFAMTKNVEELELSFFKVRLIRNSCGGDFTGGLSNYLAQPYEFPSGTFAPKILKRLILSFCKFRASTFEVFASLQKLCLMRVKVKDFSIGDLLSICPVLEDLSLTSCVLPRKYLVCKQHMKIKKLSLINCMENNRLMIPIDITAPNLSVLKIEGAYLMESTVRNAVHLLDVTINISQKLADSARGSILGSLLSDLTHCRTLSLTTWCLQVLPTGENLLESLPTPLYNMEKLWLQVGLIKQELPGISCLLRSCPNLECLTLDMIGMNEHISVDWDMFEVMIPDIYNFPADMYWELQTLPYECLDKCLKKVRINGFSGRRGEMLIIQFLLKNAAVLEDLEIHYIGTDMLGQITHQEQHDYMSTLYSKLGRLLLSPKASTLIKVLFSNMEMCNDH